MAAFPTRHLPDLAASTAVLTELLDYLRDDLAERSRQPGPDSARRPGPVAGRSSAASGPSARGSQGRRPAGSGPGRGPKGKGRRFARHEPSGLAGNILNPDQLPADKKPGDSVTLRVHSTSSDGKTIQFRVPTGRRRAEAAGAAEGAPAARASQETLDAATQ